MKKIFLITITALALGSCAKWLDVPPATSVEQKVLFESEAGFQEAVVGLYSSASEYNLYGGVFGFELPDALMQNYSYGTSDPTDYEETARFDWEYNLTRTRFNMVWNKAYNTIANCNLVLKNLEEKRGSGIFHENIAEIVEAEALAMRAYLHFDMLRLCVPVKGGYGTAPDAANGNRLAIPYVTVYTKDVTPLSTAAEAVDKVIADLVKAKTLLDGRDPILSDEYVVDYNSNTTGNGITPEENISVDEQTLPLFLQNRRHRLNYYAVCGALARAYLWKASVFGDNSAYALAAENANEVISANKFKWMTVEAATAPESSKSRDKLAYTEIIFGAFVDNEAHIKEIDTRFTNISSGYYIDQRTLNVVYEVGTLGNVDTRYNAWFNRTSDTNNAKIIKYLRNAETSNEGNMSYLVVPQIRLAEMYYIVSECIWNGTAVAGFTNEWEPLTFVRSKRNIATALNTVNYLPDELLKEYRKETYSEGQAYLNFKRLRKSNIVRENPWANYTPTANNIYSPQISDSNYEWLPTDETNNRI